MSKKLIAVVLVIAVAAALALPVASAANFSDVNPNDQNYSAIQFVGDLALIDAINGAFEPGAKATRAVALTALYRMAGKPEVEFEEFFDDVKETDWFADAVMWAKTNDFIGGFTGNSFGPGSTVTKQELSAMLLGAASIRVPVTADLSAYDDAGDVGAWAVKSMGWCVARDLIGVAAPKLEPGAPITRSELAWSLERLYARQNGKAIWVLNPIPSRSPIIATPLAPRITDWSGKTILVLGNYNGNTGTIAARLRALVGDDVRLLWAGNMTVINGQTTSPSSPPSTGNWEPRITFTPADAAALMEQVNAGTLAASSVLRQVDAVISGAGF